MKKLLKETALATALVLACSHACADPDAYRIDDTHSFANWTIRHVASKLGERKNLDYVLKDKRCAYLQVASGSVQINQQQLNAGDAALFELPEPIKMSALTDSEILLFDLPTT